MTSRLPAHWHARDPDNESPPHEHTETIASRNRARPPASLSPRARRRAHERFGDEAVAGHAGTAPAGSIICVRKRGVSRRDCQPSLRRVPGPGCVVIGPFAGVRALAGRLLFRDRPRSGGHHRRGRYARTGRAAARLARTLGFAPTRRRASRCRRDRRFSPWAVRTELCPGLRFQTGPAVGVACGFA